MRSNIRIYSFLSLVVFSLALIANLSASAEVLCYRTWSHKQGNKNVIQIFAKSCPKGFSAIPQVDIGATQIVGAKGVPGRQGPQGDRGAQGPDGVQGITGSQGAIGEPGLTGPTGDIGDQGPQGDKGAQGSTGPQGAKGSDGLKGPQGASGDNGDAGQQLFNFSGTSGSLTLNSLRTFCPINGIDFPCYNSGEVPNSDKIQYLPVVSSCSKVAFFFELSTAPESGSVSPILIKYESETLASSYPFCTIAGSATNCSGEIQANIAAGSSLALFFSRPAGVNSPRVRWSVKCTAP